MVLTSKNTKKWSVYYKNQKKLWYDPEISIYVKLIVRIIELHRSDSKGWSLSIRKIAGLLGISFNTALKYTNQAIKLGWIESSPTRQRKRRKLRLSASLRAPVEYSPPSTKFLTQPLRQPVLRDNTESVSPVESVNNNTNIKANSKDSLFNKTPSKVIKDIPSPQSFTPKSKGELAAFEVWGDLEGDNPSAFQTTYLPALLRGLLPTIFYQFRSEIKQDPNIKNPGAVFNQKVKDWISKRK